MAGIRTQAFRVQSVWRTKVSTIGQQASPCFQRSIFGMVYVYNLLPQRVVELGDISHFQRKLQLAVFRACSAGMPRWQHILRDGCRQLSVRQFHDLFENEVQMCLWLRRLVNGL